MNTIASFKYKALEMHLDEIARGERRMRAVFTSNSSHPHERKQVLDLLVQIQDYTNGIVKTISILDSPEKAEYYKRFYNQARSKRGI